MLKKIASSCLIIILSVISGCALTNYNYTGWNEYEVVQESNLWSFLYPEQWKINQTDNSLVYFYEIDNITGNEIIMAFQSRSYSVYDNFTKESGVEESNAYSTRFKSVQPLQNAIGRAHGVQEGIDMTIADEKQQELRYIEFSPTVYTYEDAATTSEQFFKLFFTENVSAEDYKMICLSCN